MHVFDVWTSSSPQATLVPNFVSVAELARGEKLDTQSLTQSLTHPANLTCREPKLIALENEIQYKNKNYSGRSVSLLTAADWMLTD